MSAFDPTSAADWETAAKMLRSELLAIAHDAAANRLPVTTSPSTGVAGRIYSFIGQLDGMTDNALAR